MIGLGTIEKRPIEWPICHAETAVGTADRLTLAV
jgi:hypothetical protein